MLLCAIGFVIYPQSLQYHSCSSQLVSALSCPLSGLCKAKIAAMEQYRKFPAFSQAMEIATLYSSPKWSLTQNATGTGLKGEPKPSSPCLDLASSFMNPRKGICCS